MSPRRSNLCNLLHKIVDNESAWCILSYFLITLMTDAPPAPPRRTRAHSGVTMAGAPATPPPAPVSRPVATDGSTPAEQPERPPVYAAAMQTKPDDKPRRNPGPPKPVQVPEDVLVAAETTYRENNKSNAAASAGKKSRATLLQRMDELGIAAFMFPTTNEHNLPCVISVGIATPVKNYVDTEKALTQLFPTVWAAVSKLAKEDKEKFLDMFEATQSAVTKHFADSVLNGLLGTTSGTRNVAVKS